ncbi:hypothetical protein C6497_02345 [Candidatus Poribacteria bacterium]|nr:MAG: hypothetical protein C6497_02345 [Candidatus Poribacteria bacterium]
MKQNKSSIKLNAKFISVVLIIIIIAIVFLIFTRMNWNKDKIQPDIATFLIDIDTNSVTPLIKELYGFNSNMMSGDYGYLDDDFITLTSTLHPQSLRFPGGTVGNFYHWKDSGFYENEMGTTLSTQLNKRNKGNFNKLRKKRNGRISFDDYMALCKRLNITPIIVVNLWTGSPSESAEWVRYALEKGYNIRHWELGNEYYLTHYKNKYPTADSYIKEARKHATAMKAVDPTIKLSICVTPVAFHEEGFLIKTGQRKWDKQLSEKHAETSTDWFDAFSVHVYAYKAMKDVPIKEMGRYLYGWIHYGIPKAMDYYEELFPNKDMWITEWNIANPANRVANTQLHALYAGDFFLKLLSFPKITQANFHVITGPGKGFPVFSPITPASTRTFWKYGGEPESDFGITIRRTVYSTFQLIGETVKQSDTLFSITLNDLPQFRGGLDYKASYIPYINTQAIGNNQYVYLLICNRFDQDLRSNITIDGRRIKKPILYRFISDNKLNATNGGNAELEGSGMIEVKIQEWNGKVDEFRIPKNSFGVLRILNIKN